MLQILFVKAERKFNENITSTNEFSRCVKFKFFINICLPYLKTSLYLQPLTKLGRIAQLVQSTWFTPKGSGVRIPLRPQNQKTRYIFFVSGFLFYSICGF